MGRGYKQYIYYHNYFRTWNLFNDFQHDNVSMECAYNCIKTSVCNTKSQFTLNWNEDRDVASTIYNYY